MKCHQRQTVGCLPVDARQNVSDLDACRFRRAARQYVGDDHPVRSREHQRRRHGWRNRLDSNANFGAVQVTELAQLLKRNVDHAAGNRESQPFVPARLREDKSVYTSHFAVHSHEWSAGISRIDRGIGLNVHHRRIKIGLPRDGRNHAHGDRVAQSSRTPESKYDFSLAQFAIRSEWECGKRSCVDFDHCEIDLAGRSNNPRWYNRGSSRERGIHGPIGIRGRQHYLDPLRTLHHMRVGHNVAAGINHKSGADRPLPADQRVGVSVLTFFERAITGHQNLHHAGRNFPDQCIHGFVELSQRIGGMILGLSVCGWQMDQQK